MTIVNISVTRDAFTRLVNELKRLINGHRGEPGGSPLFFCPSVRPSRIPADVVALPGSEYHPEHAEGQLA